MFFYNMRFLKNSFILPNIFLVIFFLLLSNHATAQKKMLIYGKVKENNSGLSGAVITVKKGSQKVRSSTTPNSGKFEFELDYGQEYIITFSKRGYVAKNISLSAKIPPEKIEETDKEFNFQVILFKQPKNEIVAFDQPVAKVTYNEISDYFDYDLDYTRSIQSLLEEIKEVQKRVEKEAKEEAKTQTGTSSGGGSTTTGQDRKTREEIEAEWAKVREEEKRKREEEAIRKEEERKAYEAARKKAQDEAQKKAADETARKEEERRRAEEARKVAQEETKRRIAEEAAKKEAQSKVLEGARKQSEEEARIKAQEEAERAKAMEDARKKARDEALERTTEEAARREAERKTVEEARERAQEEARRRASEKLINQEERRRSVEESRKRALEEAKRRAAARTQSGASDVRDRAYDRIHYKQRKVIPYPYLREADVFWEKRVWRVIDVKEKMNIPFKYPRLPFVKILLDAAES